MSSIIQKSAVFLVCATPFFSLFVEHGVSSILLCVFVLYIAALFFCPALRRVSQAEKQFIYAAAGFFFLALAIYLIQGYNYQGWKELGRILRFLFAIPILLLLARVKFSWHYFYYAVAIASIASGVSAFNEAIVLGYRPNAYGVTNPILYGGFSLIFAAICVVYSILQTRKKIILFFYFAAACGFMGVILSATRGAWIAIPAMGFWLLWWGKVIISRKQIVSLFLVLSSMLAAAYLIPQTGVQKQILRTIDSISTYEKAKSTTSVAERFEMWRAATDAWLSSPIIGVGQGHYLEVVHRGIGNNQYIEMIGKYSHPHSEYLFSLATRGLVGLLVLFIILFLPAYYGLKWSRSQSACTAACGSSLLLVSLGYAHFGLTEAVFDRSVPIGLYTLLVCILMSLAASNEYQRNTE